MSVDRLSAGYEPAFDIDAAVGRQGELLCANIAEGLRDGSVEVKTDERALATGNVFIEYECLRRGSWQPSGIATTQAEVWAFALGKPPTVLVAAPVATLLRVSRKAWQGGGKRQCSRGSHPTRGVVVSLSVLLPWLLDEERAA